MKITHEFVDFIPEELQQSVIYISIKYRTASHLCACGCGTKVVTPIRPERWHLYYNGVGVSLFPSIGNWDAPCQSHYWIENDTVEWSNKMTAEEIAWIKADQSNRIQKYHRQPQNQSNSWLKAWLKSKRHPSK